MVSSMRAPPRLRRSRASDVPSALRAPRSPSPTRRSPFRGSRSDGARWRKPPPTRGSQWEAGGRVALCRAAFWLLRHASYPGSPLDPGAILAESEPRVRVRPAGTGVLELRRASRFDPRSRDGLRSRASELALISRRERENPRRSGTYPAPKRRPNWAFFRRWCRGTSTFPSRRFGTRFALRPSCQRERIPAGLPSHSRCEREEEKGSHPAGERSSDGRNPRGARLRSSEGVLECLRRSRTSPLESRD